MQKCARPGARKAFRLENLLSTAAARTDTHHRSFATSRRSSSKSRPIMLRSYSSFLHACEKASGVLDNFEQLQKKPAGAVRSTTAATPGRLVGSIARRPCVHLRERRVPLIEYQSDEFPKRLDHRRLEA